MRKPVVTARERSPFGEIDAEIAEQAMKQSGKDIYWLPGYSDKRIKKELDERDGKPTTPLTHRYQVVGTQNLKGEPVTKAMSDFRQKGYRPVKWSEAKSLGINFEGTNYAKGSDDNVYLNGEGLLMVCDARQAAINYAKHQQAIDAQADSVQARMEDAVDKFNRNLDLRGAGATKAVFEIEQRD